MGKHFATGNKPKTEQTGLPSKYPQGFFKDKGCRLCGTVFSPKAPSELYCSQHCVDVALDNRYLKRTYGITVDDYRKLLEQQDHRCAICGGIGFLMAKTHKALLLVDHDHKTGEVRGLLCHNCNRALGLLHDNTEHLRKAIAYLEGATTIRKE